MAHAHLVVCPSCARHVRVSDATCPFCRHPVDAALRARPAPVGPTMRLSRAALVAFGAGTLSLSTACGSTPSIVTGDAGGGTVGSTSFTTSTEQPAVTLPGSSTESSASATKLTVSSATETLTTPYGTTTMMDSATSTESTASTESTESTSSTTLGVIFYGAAYGMDAGVDSALAR